MKLNPFPHNIIFLMSPLSFPSPLVFLEFWTIWNAKSSYFGFVFSELKRLLDIAPTSFVCSSHSSDFVLFLYCASIPCCTYTLWAWILYQIQLELEWVFVVWDLEISRALCWEAFTFSWSVSFSHFSPLSYILHACLPRFCLCCL